MRLVFKQWLKSEKVENLELMSHLATAQLRTIAAPVFRVGERKCWAPFVGPLHLERFHQTPGLQLFFKILYEACIKAMIWIWKSWKLIFDVPPCHCTAWYNSCSSFPCGREEMPGTFCETSTSREVPPDTWATIVIWNPLWGLY